MTLFTVVRRSLRYYWRSNVAVVLGVGVAAAVLVGSLVVGDSVRGTLRDLALERLGRTTHALVAAGFFREELADELRSQARDREALAVATPAILLEAAAHTESGRLVPRVNIIGLRSNFGKLFRGQKLSGLDGRRVALNQRLADDLGVASGDAVVVRVGRRGAAPTESLFGRRRRGDTVEPLRVVVGEIIPSRGLGAFSLRTDQPSPRNLYISLAWLQRRLERRGQANALLVAADGDARREGQGSVAQALAAVVDLADGELRLVRNAKRGYLSLESERLVLPWRVVVAARQAAGEEGMASAITSVYLANWLVVRGQGGGERKIPYSVVVGLDPQAPPPLGPLPMVEPSQPPTLGPGDMLLNTWAARELAAKVGDAVQMTYFGSEEGGTLPTVERPFTLRGIVAIRGAAADPGLVPDFEGITDADTMAEWDPPFPFDYEPIRRRPQEEVYWDKYRTTPRAYVSLPTARSLWLGKAGVASATPGRLDGDGWVTSVRVAPRPGTALGPAEEAFRRRLVSRLPPEQLGLALRPVRAEALAAARGSTDFGVLFLSMSMFLVASAAALVGLLLRLSVERRASQFGILLATGFTPGRAARMLMGEGLALSLIGVAVGTPLGVAYAWGIIAALRTWWRGAAGDFTFALHVEVPTLALGAAAGCVVAAATLWWSARVLRRTQGLRLLAGWRAMAAVPLAATRRRARWIGIVAVALAAVGLVLSAGLGVVSPTGAFFGIGAALLVGALALVAAWLQRREAPGASGGRLSLWRLSVRGASRHWLRSVLTVGLLAAASFVIVTVAANRRDPSRLDTRRRDSGAGGFNLVARADVPIHADLGTPGGREQLALSRQGQRALAGDVDVLSFHLTSGDDVSCLNLQRPVAPAILGVPRQMIRRGGFRFTRHLPLAAPPRGEANPWRLLERDLGATKDGGPVIAAFADAASARWILKVGLGEELEVASAEGGTVRLRLVGLLAGSVFQGQLLVSAGSFRRHLSRDAGYRYFLIRTSPPAEQLVAETLRRELGDLGLDVRRTADLLTQYARVQNTYLSTFETLGGLGLLLGTFGLVAVVLRSVLERRAELAMMLALGFLKRRLFGTIVMENGLLLCVGVAVGAATALVAVAPHLASAQADVRWASLALTLMACVAVGLLSCSAAAAGAMRGDLVPALRSE